MLRANPAFDDMAPLSQTQVTVRLRDGRSLIGVATLAVGQGDEIVVRARGPQAAEALDALRALAAENFGDAPEGQPAGERVRAGADRPAATGVGLFQDYAEGARAMTAPAKQFAPDRESGSHYARRYGLYEQLARAMQPVWAEMGRQ